MPVYPCRWPTCTAYVRERRGYCDAHAEQGKQDQQARHRFYDEHFRDAEAKKFYDSAEWQRVRRQKLTLDPVCEKCIRVFAEHVHHKIPLKKCMPAQRLDLANLMSLCQPCHNEITAEDKHVH